MEKISVHLFICRSERRNLNISRGLITIEVCLSTTRVCINIATLRAKARLYECLFTPVLLSLASHMAVKGLGMSYIGNNSDCRARGDYAMQSRVLDVKCIGCKISQPLPHAILMQSSQAYQEHLPTVVNLLCARVHCGAAQYCLNIQAASTTHQHKAPYVPIAKCSAEKFSKRLTGSVK